MLGGVAGGLAEHLELPVVPLRLGFAVLALAGGAGVLLYAALWALLPQRPDASGPVTSHRTEVLGRVLAVAMVAAGALLVLARLGLTPSALLPLAAATGGVALVWTQADEAQRARWRSAGSDRQRPLVVLAGAALLVVGVVGFLATKGELRAAREGLLSTTLLVVGLAVLSAPWWVGMATDLRDERRERIRSQERAEMATLVHDSVLQTLAMIRKAAQDPAEVSRLARAQERALRGVLYAPRAHAPGSGLAAALEAVVAEVELAHPVTVELVVVGDCPAGERVRAAVAATREAVLNAARHAGVASVSVYAEVRPDRVEVFVRDRGTGFDVSTVPADRFGVAQSIVGRMERHGGHASVRSAPGEGTEVRLEVGPG